MTDINEEKIQATLQHYLPPFLESVFQPKKHILSCTVVEHTCSVHLRYPFPIAGKEAEITAHLTAYLKTQHPEIDSVDLTLDWSVQPRKILPEKKRHPEIRNIIAVASGKGGVGKSTTSASLAIMLSKLGARVGLLDADIHGPNQSRMLGSFEQPMSPDGKQMFPILAQGIQMMSMGNLVEADAPLIWRGPMASAALMQLYNDTAWENLDYLIVDLPPGTGDIQLSLVQQIPVTAAIVVTTPQSVACMDVSRAIAMFDKVHLPILGIVENMSGFRCPCCGNIENIFGEGGAEQLAQQHHLSVLAHLPLDPTVRAAADTGTLVSLDLAEVLANYEQLAFAMLKRLSALPVYTTPLPSISIAA